MATSTHPSPPPALAKSPLAELLAIAGPTVATLSSYTLMQFVDKLMVSRIGPDPIYVGAQGNGGLTSFIPIAIVMGMLHVVNTYVSQNFGAGRPDCAPAYAWSAMWIALSAGILLIPYGISLPHILNFARTVHFPWSKHILLSPAEIAEAVRRDAMAGSYGQILVFGAALTLCCRGISQFFYGLHKPVVVLIAGVASNIANFVLSTVLVFGSTPPAPTGLPIADAWFHTAASIAGIFHISPHGVPGSAIGTVIATGIELAIPLSLFLSPAYNAKYRTRSQWRPRRAQILDILRLGWPGGLMFGNEMICWGFFMVFLVGKFGKAHSTAGWIAHQWMTMSFMPTVGLSIAVTATVGKCMGMGRPDLAAQRAWTGLKLALAYMGFCAVCFIIFRVPMTRLFIQEQTAPQDVALVVDLATKFLIAAAAFQVFDAIAMTLSGALRGAGDTVWVGVVTITLAWALIVVGGLAMIWLFPNLKSAGPWIASASYVIVLALAVLGRFLSGKWKTIKLVDKAEEAVALELATSESHVGSG